MEWTKRKMMIIYITILLLCFISGGLLFPTENKIIEHKIKCKNGSIEIFDYNSEWICGGDPNPLRKNIIKTNLSLIIK